MKVCTDCKSIACHGPERRCFDCRKRSTGKRLLNRDVHGVTLCLCGCGKPAESVYLTDACYSRHIQRKTRGQWPSLLNACPLWYGPELLFVTPVLCERPIPYHGPELSEVVPDGLFAAEMQNAKRNVQRLPLISDGMAT